MEIVIPKANIYNYNFNILENNFIESATISYKNYLNWNNNIYLEIFNSSGEFYTNQDNVTITQEGILNYTFEDGEYTFCKIMGKIDLNNIVYPFSNNLENNIDYISDITFYDISKSNSSIIENNIKFQENVYLEFVDNAHNVEFLEPDKDKICVMQISKNMTENKEIHFNMTAITSFKNNATGNINFYKSHYLKFKFIPTFEEKTYTIGTAQDDIYKVEFSSFNNDYTRYNKQLTNPQYYSVLKNIRDNYKNGKMTMEIETRYTTFKDSNGNYINDGKPYLIKVGDIVRPEMTDKFKNFNHKYVVTSAKYEYNGSDKLYLKLLQI